MPINVGGDDSVRWEVDVNRARYQDLVTRPDPVAREGEGPYQNIGVEATDEDEPYVYTVVIKIPKSGRGTARNAKAQFAASLTLAAQQARAAVKNTRITSVAFQLPVEDKEHGGANHDQIQIDWSSHSFRAAPSPRRRAAPASGRGAGRKRGR